MPQPQYTELNDLYLVSCTPFCIVDGSGQEISAFPEAFTGFYSQSFYLTLIETFRQSVYPNGVLEYYVDECRFAAITNLRNDHYFITAPVSASAARIDRHSYLNYIRPEELDRFIRFMQDIPPKLNFPLFRLTMLAKYLYDGTVSCSQASVKYFDSNETVPLLPGKSEAAPVFSAVPPNTAYYSAFHTENLKECVRNGDFAAFYQIYHRPVSGSLGVMGNTSIQQMKYSYIALLHIIATAAAEGGMPHEYSFDLFSRYCQEMDKLHNVSEIERLKLTAASDFCKKVAECRGTKQYHKTTIESIQYIHKHIYQRICISELSAHVHLNRSTLSAYFKQDTGMTITAFINAVRLKEAKYLLEDRNIDYPQIIDLLGFCNQSYFIKKFHEHFGITPQQYRDRVT